MKRLRLVLISLLIFCALKNGLWGAEEVAAQTGAVRRVKIVAFVDLSESNTKRFFQTTYKTIKQSYGDRVEFVLRQVPRPSPGSPLVARGFYCAADQSRQWDFVEALAAGNHASDRQGMIQVANQLRLNAALFSGCLDRVKTRALVDSDIREANKVGLRGVPAFFVQGEYIEGLVGFEIFRPIIDRQLQTTTRSPLQIRVVYNPQLKLEDPQKAFSYLTTYYFPESELSLISHRSAEGQKVIKEVGARALPVALFSREIEQSPQFKYFKEEVEKRGTGYILKLESYAGILEFFETPQVGNDPVKGNSKAPITLMEFSDFECPSCGQFVRTTLPKIVERYVNTGQARVVFRNYPLMTLHPKAEAAALAGECAQKAGIFWKYHDTLYQNAKNLDRPSLIKYAEALGQPGSNFAACLSGAEARAELQKDISDGKRFGVRSTPTLLINNYRVLASDPSVVYAVIDHLIRKRAAQPASQKSTVTRF